MNLPRLFLSLAVLPLTLLAEERKQQPDFGVILNDDADLAFTVADPKRAEALLRHNIAALGDTPIKTFAFCIGMGSDILCYDTKVASPIGWRVSEMEKKDAFMAIRMENARKNLAAGVDAVRVAGEAAKAAGIRFIASQRMNDGHFAFSPETHAMTSRFWINHHEKYSIKDSPLTFRKGYENLLDFSHEAVRNHRRDIAFEVIGRNRKLIDGYELDFTRFQVFFPKGKAAERAHLMTDLVRQIRERLRKVSEEEGRPMYLLVRVPPSPDDCAFAGLEVEQWMKEGLVDLVAPGQIMTLAWDMPMAKFVEWGKKYGVAIYPTLYPRVSWRLAFPENKKGDRYSGERLLNGATLEETRGAVANYWREGVTGFYLFNYYSTFGGTRPHGSDMYLLLHDLARPANIAGTAKVYSITKSYYHDGPGSYAYGKQLPHAVKAGEPLAVTLPVGEQPAQVPFSLKTCELRIGLRGASAEKDRIAVTLNGEKLENVATVYRPSHSAVDLKRRPDAAEEYIHYFIDEPSLVRYGENAITVAASNGATLCDVELRYEYNNNYTQIWRRTEAPLNQRFKAAP